MDANCPVEFISTLSACDWSTPCAESSNCFQGEFGIWGNVLNCQAGGYYEPFSTCVSWQSSSELSSSSIQIGVSSSSSYFDWNLAAQGMRESFGVFLSLFVCYLTVKLLWMVNK